MEPAGPEKSVKNPVEKEIRAMMAGIIAASENVDVDRTYSFLTRDPAGIFFVNNKSYLLNDLLALFRDTYGKLRSQKLTLVRSEVIPLGPDAALWIGNGEGRTESRTGGVAMTYSFTETWAWQKIRGTWVVIHYHESSG